MNREMFDFLIEFTLYGSGSSPQTIPESPKVHWMDRPFAKGYSTHPELSRNPVGALLSLSAPFWVPLTVATVAGTAFVSTSSEHKVTNVTGEMSVPVTEETFQYFGF